MRKRRKSGRFLVFRLSLRINQLYKKFPKYTTQILNLANQNAQDTRPKVVGQLSELIKECPYNSYEKWTDWYLSKKPDAIDNATERILKKFNR
ncbi:MAG: hypothetical protein B5M53_07145 [Candidatus Cloacimonas sp. 4484_209]|nr:MAG: hypothetical protein B5M53_07145 [Candidatus Cloacimonas sp. 4484_209]